MSPTRMVRHELRARRLRVESVVELSPTMRRFALGGETDAFPHVAFAPAEHVRLVLPDAEGFVHLPLLGQARPQFEGEAPEIRDYTVRAVDERGRVIIDMITDHDGPAACWAREAGPGSPLGVLGPRGSSVMPEASHYVLYGDETALPALGRWLEEAPAAARIDVVADVRSASRFDLPEHPGANVTWVEGTTPVLDALGHVRWSDDTIAWAAGEVGALRQIRSFLSERQVPLERRLIAGYWQRGNADFDHHAPLDDAA